MPENKWKTAAWLYADMTRSVWGTPSRIADDIAGVNVLNRTLARLAKVKSLNEIIVFCPIDQKPQIEKLVNPTLAQVHGLKEPVPISNRIRLRKWSLESWRGGLAEATCFDEQMFTAEMVQLGRDRGFISAATVPSEAVLIDPKLLDEQIIYHKEHGGQMRFTFSQTPVGLSCCVYRLDLLHELILARGCVGDLMKYNPDNPYADPIIKECNYKPGTQLPRPQLRCLADTQRSFDAIEHLIELAGAQMDLYPGAEITEAMSQQQNQGDLLPREIEIEINTQPSLRIEGYPHRMTDIDRGEMTLEQFEKIVNDCRGYDDIVLTIGGFGEPLAHPQLAEMIKIAKQAGILGINIETDGQRLKGQVAQNLLKSDLDVISVYLDANSDKLYKQIKQKDCFRDIQNQLQQFITKSKSADSSGPIVVPHLIKTKETMEDMEDFYDRWKKETGYAVIVGYNDFAGQIADKAVMNMEPPQRRACRRLPRCMTILADGSVTICTQDFKGKNIVGNVFTQSVKELWRSDKLQSLRRAHLKGDFSVNPLCQKCKEWHR